MSSHTSQPAPGAKIALAMQSPQMGRMLVMVLRWQGFQPHLLENGTRALDALQHELYGAAILDAHLAPLDGFMICARVRAATSTPIILLLEEVTERIQARESGASAELLLPFDLDELLACLAEVLRPAGLPEGREIPQEDAAQVTEESAEDVAEPGETSPRVLVAAASRRVRATLRALLDAADYPVLEAADGVEAIDLLLRSPTPLVVLLDLLLPRLSGHQVLLHASANPTLLARHRYAVLTTAELPAERLDAQVAALVAEQTIPVLQRPLSGERVLAVVEDLRARLLPPDQEHATRAAQAEYL